MNTKPLQLREYPNASYPFLRFQVGHPDKRDGFYEKKIDGMWVKIGIGPVSVWTLKGFGSTLDLAYKMAGTK